MIVQGGFKGHRGRVTQVNAIQVTVELSSGNQKISLPREAVKEIDSEDSMSIRPRNDGQGGASAYGP